jgi:putative hemolysin
MRGLGAQLLLVAGLVLVNAALAGTEIALVSLRDAQAARLAGRGRAGRALSGLLADPNRYLATIQVGITLSGFLASATAAVTLAEPLVPGLDVLGGAARPAAILLVTLALTFVTLVVGELTPKRLAMQRAEGWSLVAARPLSVLATVSRPIVWLLGRTTNLLVRLLGGDPTRQGVDVTEGELRDMVEAQPELTTEERAIIRGAFEFADRTLREIVVPRTSVVALSADLAAAEAAQELITSGHVRAPVYRGDLDDVAGIVHLRSLVAGEGSAADHLQPVLELPETVGALDALRRLQRERQQMAVVVNEHGGTEGIITVEDLLEELVGEIWDEADPDLQAVRRQPDGSLSVEGAYPIHDLPDIGVDLPAGDYTTVAGLVLDRLGHLPDVGEQVTVGRWRLRVEDATDRRIRRVRISEVR